MSLVARRSGVWSTLLGGILFLYSELTFALVAYSPTGCEYTVQFPDQPELKSLYAPDIGSYQNASHYGSNYFIRSECFSISGPVDAETAYSITAKYVEINGFQNTVYEFSDDHLGYSIEARGNKTIGDTHGTFVIAAYFGERSLMVLFVGSASSAYPTEEIFSFLNSCTR
jgi:hypothetical protein